MLTMPARRSCLRPAGSLRDIDYGIYPYTTSSNTIGAYAPIGAGIPGRKLNKSIGIMKAYSSCVGDGPFTTELAMTEEEKHLLREAGHEYGAATGARAALARLMWLLPVTAFSARAVTSWP